MTAAPVAASENMTEWLEGMATYAEGRVCGLAAGPSYRPLDLMAGVPDFHGYAHIKTPKSASLDGAADLSSHARSYLVGAGICWLLDRLGAELKKPAIEEFMPLEELLHRALESK